VEATRTRALASHVLGIELLERVATALKASAIPIVPLKGIWLQTCVLPFPDERPITDVDLLVPEARFEEALQLLVRGGFEPRHGNASERALYHPACPLPLDLHRRLFQPGSFDLPTATIMARAQRGQAAGIDLWLPDPLDALAHLVGHFVKSRRRPSERARTADFVAIAERFTYSPSAWAERLHGHGFARAARYAFLERKKDYAFLEDVCRALPTDPVGERIARLCAHLPITAQAQVWAALPGYALERSLAKSMWSIVQRVRAG
jgi:hypothetical protein